MTSFVHQGQKFTVSNQELSEYINELQRRLSVLSDQELFLSKEFNYARQDYFKRTNNPQCPTVPSSNQPNSSAQTVTVTIHTDQLPYRIKIHDPKLTAPLTATLKTNAEGDDLNLLAFAAQSFIESTHKSMAAKENSCLRYEAEIELLKASN